MIRFLLIVCLSLVFTRSGNGQNLVPNPSFEDTVVCPIAGDELYKAQFWSAFRASPDYFHTCCNQSNYVVGVPQNDLGYQYPHSGNAYAGMITYDLTGSPYREYLGVLLTNPLVTGTKYFLSFYLNWSGKIGFTIANNKIGVVISDSLYTPSSPYPINNNPIVYCDSIITDSIGWFKVNLSFIANSSGNYLIFGNFFDDLNTDTMNLGMFNQHAYYYIDDVCLSVDSNLCASIVGSESVDDAFAKQNLIRNYYFDDGKLIIEFFNEFDKKEIKIFTIDGKLKVKAVSNDKQVIIQYNSKNSLNILQVVIKNNLTNIKLINIK